MNRIIGDDLPIPVTVAVVVTIALEKVVVTSAWVCDRAKDVLELWCRGSGNCRGQGEEGDGDECRGLHGYGCSSSMQQA